MAKVTVYSSMWCPYCTRAKKLLDSKGVNYEDIDVTMDAAARLEMTQKSGGQRTVPQIFIDDRHIGGSDELAALDQAGKLDGLLGAA
ncbi:MAG: glutaredoxin 3 [Sphingomonadales bacterium]